MQSVTKPMGRIEESEYPEVLKFFEDLLRKDSDCRLEEEYPLAFDSQALDGLLIIRDGTKIQAGLSTLIREVEIRPGEISRMMFVGSVVTSPEFRKQGLQRQIFVELSRRAEDADVDFVVLWSNKLEFYKKLGFMLGGLQATWLPTHTKPLGQKKFKIQFAPTKEVAFRESFFNAFNQKKLRVGRSFEEMEKLWRIPQMEVAFTDNAYALLGKGEDFRDVCHEWAGPADEVLACIDLLREKTEYFRVLSPGVLHTEDEQDVAAAFENASFDNRLEFLGLFRAVSHRYPEAGLDPHHIKYPFFIWGLDSI